MISIVDYGVFSWKTFFKMLWSIPTLRIDVLPKPGINFHWGSISFFFHIGLTGWPRKLLHINKYSIGIHYYVLELDTFWWAHSEGW